MGSEFRQRHLIESKCVPSIVCHRLYIYHVCHQYNAGNALKIYALAVKTFSIAQILQCSIWANSIFLIR